MLNKTRPSGSEYSGIMHMADWLPTLSEAVGHSLTQEEVSHENNDLNLHGFSSGKTILNLLCTNDCVRQKSVEADNTRMVDCNTVAKCFEAKFSSSICWFKQDGKVWPAQLTVEVDKDRSCHSNALMVGGAEINLTAILIVSHSLYSPTVPLNDFIEKQKTRNMSKDDREKQRRTLRIERERERGGGGGEGSITHSLTLARTLSLSLSLSPSPPPSLSPPPPPPLSLSLYLPAWCSQTIATCWWCQSLEELDRWCNFSANWSSAQHRSCW